MTNRRNCPRFYKNLSVPHHWCIRVVMRLQLKPFSPQCFLPHQIEIVILETFNPFPNKPWFLHVCSTSLLNTQWEKEKLLTMSNFSFSHNVLYSFSLEDSKNCHLVKFNMWYKLLTFDKAFMLFS